MNIQMQIADRTIDRIYGAKMTADQTALRKSLRIDHILPYVCSVQII